MKKGIIGALIALCGSAVAIGTAFALYTGNLPEDKTIQIGTKTTGDVVLHADVKDAALANKVLTPAAVERCIVFNAGFTTNEGSVYIQDYYNAKLEFKISSESEAMIDALKEETWVEFGTQTDVENQYSTYWKAQTLNDGNVQESQDGKSLTYTMDYPLFKGEDISEFKFHIRLDQDVKDAEYKTLGKQTYFVDFTVSEPTSSTQAYIVGTAVGGWEDRAEFRMTKNAKADHDEWMFKTGTVDGKQKLQDGKEYKLHVGSVYCDSKEENHVWHATDDGKTFYWNGLQNNDHGNLFN